MPDRMSDRMSKYLPDRISDRRSKCYTSRWYVRRYVRSYVRMMFFTVGTTRRKKFSRLHVFSLSTQTLLPISSTVVGLIACSDLTSSPVLETGEGGSGWVGGTKSASLFGVASMPLGSSWASLGCPWTGTWGFSRRVIVPSQHASQLCCFERHCVHLGDSWAWRRLGWRVCVCVRVWGPEHRHQFRSNKIIDDSKLRSFPQVALIDWPTSAIRRSANWVLKARE